MTHKFMPQYVDRDVFLEGMGRAYIIAQPFFTRAFPTPESQAELEISVLGFQNVDLPLHEQKPGQSWKAVPCLMIRARCGYDRVNKGWRMDRLVGLALEFGEAYAIFEPEKL